RVGRDLPQVDRRRAGSADRVEQKRPGTLAAMHQHVTVHSRLPARRMTTLCGVGGHGCQTVWSTVTDPNFSRSILFAFGPRSLPAPLLQLLRLARPRSQHTASQGPTPSSLDRFGCSI